MLATATGLAIFWLHWFMGSPGLNNVDRAVYVRQRILSAFGAWVCKKFNDRAEAIGRKTWEQAQGDDLNKKLAAQAKLAENYVNWWFAAGVCPICFGVHISNFIYVAAWFLMGLTWPWLLCIGFFTGVSLTVLSWQIER